MKKQNCKTQCLCDICLKARGEEIERFKKGRDEAWRAFIQSNIISHLSLETQQSFSSAMNLFN